MLNSIIPDIRGLIMHPKDTYIQLKNSSLTQAYQHYVILLIFYSVLSGILSLFSAVILWYDLLFQFASVPIIGSMLAIKMDLFRAFFIHWSIFIVYLMFLVLLFAVFFKGFVLHVFVILLGGEEGIARTVQAVMYAVTPFFLLGWTPYLSIIGFFWAIILCILGIQVMQDIPLWKASAVIIIPLILWIIGIMAVLFLMTDLVNAISGIF